MRILPAALAVSAVLHGAAIAYVHSRPQPKPEPQRRLTIETIEIQPAPAAEPVPTEVTLLDDHSVAAPASLASSAGHTRSGKTKQHVVGSRGAVVETAPPVTQEPSPPPRSSLMTMRHPKLENGPSAAFWDKFAANTKPLAKKEIASEQLADEVATTAGHLHDPRWIANASADEVRAEREKLAAKRYEQSTAELRPDGAGTKAEHHTFKARFAPDGTVSSIDDGRNVRVHGLSGEFDVTDAMMRRHGIDPYSSAKLKALDETRDERVAIGKRYRTQQLAQSKQLMEKNLERLWTKTQDLAARKRGLFELWDDCAESGSDELVAGGAAARAYVIGFIRSKLPAASADAFTADELARFNKQRKSRLTFQPYDATL